jgi:hypothetical protein
VRMSAAAGARRSLIGAAVAALLAAGAAAGAQCAAMPATAPTLNEQRPPTAEPQQQEQAPSVAW